MTVLDPLTLPPVPWKNGGGVTREIAGSPPTWRLSLADVASEGPFSVFSGLERILTVIEGAGMELHFEQQVRQALLGEPLRFSGDDPVTGVLPHGPIRDLNLIYDPHQVNGTVEVFEGAQSLPTNPAEVATYVLTGSVSCQGQKMSAGKMMLQRAAPIALIDGTKVIRISISERP
ncbi:HutD family protein [Ruegeria sp. WL0004]|uniref:HutD family protein n=1 Tax=Ruegeria marisflavi TaxID=2984152 RepID=A0ABT2WMV1_9RHOB|nr:HutD family protein [Ruegeria sp. WL0004]MCU9837037.1 HutD family protein [Ruegeria sp. WL0004]